MTDTDAEALRRLAAESEAVARKLERGVRTVREAGAVRPGASAREAVHVDGKLTLYRYRPRVPTPARPPLLVVYAMVNRPEIADLQDDRSLLRGLLDAGRDVFLLDWGVPDAADARRGLSEYALDAIEICIDAVCALTDVDVVHLLGICQGGTFTLCYAALRPARIGALVAMVTPVDFHTPDNLLRQWVRHLDVDLLAEALGNVPGELLNQVFVSLKPLRLGASKYLDMLDQLDDVERAASFLRMEQWIHDSPAQPARAFAEFVKWFYQENRLVRGELELDGARVDLGAITMPVLNVYAARDHIVPPAASLALARLVGSEDYSTLAFDGGHIGIYASARAQREIPPAIARWLGDRSQMPRHP